MFGYLKITGVVVAGVVILACVSMFLFIQVCSGQMSACYAAWHSPDSMKRERSGALTQFAASPTAIAFPVVLDNDERGLLFIDRNTGRSKLIYEKGNSFWSPHLSADGERLVLIKRHDGIARREIISCSIATWQCAVLLRTENNLRSPVEIGGSRIVYSSSPLFVGSDGRHRYMDWDFYLLKKGSEQVRLSDFRLYELDSISVVNDTLIFSGAESKRDNPVLPESKPLLPNRSEIFAVELDQQAQRIRKPPGTLTPLFMIGGLSVSASVSHDGSRGAVLNTETDKGRYYRYDMVLAKMDGSVQRRINVEGIGFSPGAFVGETLLFNELFEDRYEVRLLDLASNALQSVLLVEHAPDKLRALERIRLAVDGESVQVRP
jgi:hypothetical protein